MNSPDFRNELPSTPKAFTSVGKDSTSPFLIPPTPMMTRIGYGTGVSVYHVDRSPRFGQDRSPWVVKKRNAKVQRGHISERLYKEAHILRALDHPNIVGFRGFTKSSNGNEVLVMEECTQSLGDFIEEYEKSLGPFSEQTIFKVTLGVCNALHYLHEEKKLIHGDIKSYNILIKGGFETIKLCDFGVSIRVGDDGTSTEEYVGSLPWTAPEVLEEGPVTPAVDIFSLGLTIYEMLALRTPHLVDYDESYLDKTMDSDAMEASMEEPPYGTRPALPELGFEYSDIISLYEACTEQDYSRRPKPGQIVQKLLPFISGQPIYIPSTLLQ